MKEFAVVFDCAGTLLEKYRVAKSIDEGIFLHQIVSLNLIGTRADYVLAVFELDAPPDLRGVPVHLSIADFLRQYNINLVVVCANVPISKRKILSAVARDSKSRVKDLVDVVTEVSKNCSASYFTGTAAVIDIEQGKIPYVLATCGELFDVAVPVVDELKRAGADIYVASGDAKNTLFALADRIHIPYKNVSEVATPSSKEKLVCQLKKKYRYVVMVGDGINDIPALKAANLGVLTVQQKEERPETLYEAADLVIKDLALLPGILKNIITNNRHVRNESKEAAL
ncbi:MAG TPA: HAD-IC family P-type ATPase [Candidatus Bathyarchaeia archaeon]|jgi:Cu+-exporting ATPase|nr:HAD-IC family P-type ATPase [Candidatus Bathyarchaeia archaeon]HYB59150.1 HAD-IC family P-type ATPase [Candidatus Acidoferrales bacterium]